MQQNQDTTRPQRFVKRTNGVFERYSVAIPFADNQRVYGNDTTWDELKAAGYYKLIEIQPQYNKVTHRIKSTHIDKVDDDYAKLRFEYEELPDALENLREFKSVELKMWAGRVSESYVVDIANFGKVSGGYRHIQNLEIMLDNYDDLPRKELRLQDNTFKPVTKELLERILKIVQMGGVELLNRKWTYENAIKEAHSLRELNEIVFDETIKVGL